MGSERLPALDKTSATQRFVLDDLAPDPNVARRLAPNLAFRHHALPVAGRDHCFTVAMADPTDAVAREAVAGALGAEPCVVESDVMAIDLALSQIWNERDRSPPSLLASLPANLSADQLGSYADYVGSLLNAEVNRFPAEIPLDVLLRQAGDDCELVIWQEGAPGSDGTVWPDGVLREAVDCLPTPLLVARTPRQPFSRLLLVIQGVLSDHKATDWAIRLAASSGAVVTALALVPPVSPACSGLSCSEGGLAELLSADTVLGRQMRRVARRLVDRGIECTLRLRQGQPVSEIRREAVEGLHDLTVASVAPRGGARRWRFNESPISLLRAMDRPMLIAR